MSGITLTAIGIAAIAIPMMPVTAAPAIAVANPATMAFGPAYRAMATARGLAVSIAVMTATAATTIVAIPVMPTLAPIAAVIISKVEPSTIVIEHIYPVTGIPIIAVPTATIADVVKAIAIVAVIICIERAIRVTVIAAIATVIGAKPHVIIAA
jgi:hypothetical protein